MALNEVYAEALSLNYVVDEEVLSGDFVVLVDPLTAGVSLRGVAEIDAKLGADGNNYATLRHVGVFTGTSAEAFAAGQTVYLAAGTFGTELATSGSYAVGVAIKAKDAVAGDVHVRINN
jgi:predicted RecA/RadA family phage recombinase